VTDWILILAVAGIASFNDINVFWMPEAQCRAALEYLATGHRLGVACIGPSGETVLPRR